MTQKPAQVIEAKIKHKMFGIEIPTFISECPHCGEPKKWSTTGLEMPLECNKCGTIYDMFKK